METKFVSASTLWMTISLRSIIFSGNVSVVPASIQGMTADVHALRRGLALVRAEKEKLDNPPTLQISFTEVF